MIYRYKDFATGQMRYTRGKFCGWTSPTGPLNVCYAIFKRKWDDVLVPKYLLTKETLEELTEKEDEMSKEMKIEAHEVMQIGEHEFRINGRPYTIRFVGRGDCGEVLWECDCPAGRYGRTCKHIKTVADWNADLAGETGQE